MEQNNAVWLSHLSNEIVTDARGPEFDAYLVALEGWRRGLKLRWHTKDSEKFNEMKTWFVDKPGKLFSLSSGDKTHYFFRTRGDKVTNEAVEIGADKEATKQRLTDAGIPVPEGKRFKADVPDEEIVAHAATIGYPVVLKPTDGSFGRGVITNIRNEEALKRAIVHLRTNQKEPDVILERYIVGQEYRLYVVGDTVVGAINRIPVHVIGDGESTIEALIDQKNEIRESNPRLVSCLIKKNKELKEFLQAGGYSLASVPKQGEQLFLSNKSNISIGGDPVDVLDELPEAYKQVAVKALQAIPGLEHGAVDVLVEQNKPEAEAAVVLELNPTAQIGSIVFPLKGKARDVPAAIIDHYFPETKELSVEKSRFYFDFDDVLEPLFTKVANVSTVSMAPLGTIYAKKYTVSGKVQGIDYHRGLRKQAFERNLSGYVLNLSNGDIDVIVAGTHPEMVNDFKQAILDDPERSEVINVEETIWEAPVKVGFEVKADLKTQIEKLKQMKQEMELVEREYKRVEREYMKYQQSLSWRLTTPLRTVSELVKQFKR